VAKHVDRVQRAGKAAADDEDMIDQDCLPPAALRRLMRSLARTRLEGKTGAARRKRVDRAARL
jgi:hypothetical protein